LVEFNYGLPKHHGSPQINHRSQNLLTLVSVTADQS